MVGIRKCFVRWTDPTYSYRSRMKDVLSEHHAKCLGDVTTHFPPSIQGLSMAIFCIKCTHSGGYRIVYD